MKVIKISLAFALIFALSACDDKSKQAASQQQMPPSLVDVKAIENTQANLYYEYPAKLEAIKDVTVLAKVSGEVKKVYFEDGSFVKEGDVLFKINDEQYKANLDVALADVQVARANYENAHNEYKRTKDLYNKKAVSKKEFDAKDASYKIANANLAKANAAYKLAKLNYAYTEVKAPFDGVVQDSLVDVGQFVAANNTKLVQILDISKIKASFFIPDSDRVKLSQKESQNSSSIVNANTTINYKNKDYFAKLDYFSDNFNLASSKAYAIFDNPNNELNPGAFVKLKITDIKRDNSIVISKANILQDINGYYVYVKRNNKAEQVYVNPIFEDEKIAVIDNKYKKADFKEGDMLILNNYKKIHAGSNVATDAEFGAMMRAAMEQKAKAEQGR